MENFFCGEAPGVRFVAHEVSCSRFVPLFVMLFQDPGSLRIMCWCMRHNTVLVHTNGAHVSLHSNKLIKDVLKE